MCWQLAGQLLDALKLASDETTGATLEGRIRGLWLNARTSAVSLLTSRGAREIRASALCDALDDPNAALDLQTELTAVWAVRSSAAFDAGNTTEAVIDLQQLLRLEPGQFDSFQSPSRIAEQRHHLKGAYDAWVMLMEIDPMTPRCAEPLKDLRPQALGTSVRKVSQHVSGARREQ